MTFVQDGDVMSEAYMEKFLIGYGLLSARPTAASDNEGQAFYATDTGLLYRSNGSSWDQILLTDPTEASGDPGLRTLGSGANQAAAGNHTHPLSENAASEAGFAADDVSESGTTAVPVGTSSNTVSVSWVLTPNSTDSMLCMGGGCWVRNVSPSIDMDVRCYLKIDSTLESFTEEATFDTGGSPNALYVAHGGGASGYSGSTTVRCVITQDGGGSATDLHAYDVSMGAGFIEVTN